ncbi:unnamed protein product [Caenorhabditis nigoni]
MDVPTKLQLDSVKPENQAQREGKSEERARARIIENQLHYFHQSPPEFVPRYFTPFDLSFRYFAPSLFY